MARVKKFIDTDVLSEAKKRIHHIYDLFDSVAVCFSGGKDSLVVLHLAHEVQLERGIKSPVNVLFRDEELIPDEVVNFVDEYRKKDWCKIYWLTVPLQSTKYVLGICYSYVQWDPAREWVRQKPAWGISLPPGDTRVFDQYNIDYYCSEFFKGKVAYLLGIRSDESIIRYRSCVEKLNENYINKSGDPMARNVNLCKPIYDWSKTDVFKYFYDKQIKYCPIYDYQMFAGNNLRVSTPLHAEAAKRFDLIKTTTPDFYERVIKVFPEMLVQERYYRDIDKNKDKDQYGTSLRGIRQWIDKFITDEVNHKKAVDNFNRVAGRHLRNPEIYPLRYLLGVFMSGGYKRQILPQPKQKGKKK